MSDSLLSSRLRIDLSKAQWSWLNSSKDLTGTQIETLFRTIFERWSSTSERLSARWDEQSSTTQTRILRFLETLEWHLQREGTELIYGDKAHGFDADQLTGSIKVNAQAQIIIGRLTTKLRAVIQI